MPETPEPPEHPGAAPSEVPESRGWIFAHGAFSRLFAGSLLANLGDRLYQMAVIGAVQFSFPVAVNQIAAVTFVGVLAQFILYPLIGSLVDRMDRRRLLWLTCAIKIPVVLTLLPLLLRVKTAWFAEHWTWSLLSIFALAVVAVPFGPARASAIPDVIPKPRMALAASLIAITGLAAILGGTELGTQVNASFGPLWSVPLATVLYALAVLLLRGLPDAVSVPGVARGEAQGLPAPARPAGWLARVREDLRGNWSGLRYAAGTRGIPALILFETIFWLTGVCFYLLNEWHGAAVLHLPEAEKALYWGHGLGCAGIGLFLGALTMGKLCRFISPLFSYPVAVACLGAAMLQVFGARGVPSPLGDAEAIQANLALGYSLFPWLGLMGFGGGLLIGRIDADLLVATDESMRGRVFALKGFFFTGALMAPLILFMFPVTDATFEMLAYFLPRVLLVSIPAVAALSWFLDCGLYAGRSGGVPAQGIQELLFYRFARFLSYLICKLYFRMRMVGLEKIPATGPVVLAANHGSFLDPFWLGSGINRYVQYIMHASYYNSIAHPFFRMLMTIPVDDKSQIRALKAGAEALKEGICVAMFPEGHVSDDGKLQKPKSGALFLAQRSGAVVIPVAVIGNTRSFARWHRIPRPFQITLQVGDPFTVPKDASRKEVAELTDKVMSDLARMLGEAPPPKCADDVPDRGRRGRDGDAEAGS